MNTINRSAVVVIPAQPFLVWLHQADPTSAQLSLNDLRKEATLYLLPEYDTEEEARQHLQKRCGKVFEEELDGWYSILQPRLLTGASRISSAGFEYEFHSVIIDLCGHPIVREEL